MENNEGGRNGTLLSQLDHCVTPGGRNCLRAWLCRPLLHGPDIVARQDAVADLLGCAAEAASAAREKLRGTSLHLQP